MKQTRINLLPAKFRPNRWKAPLTAAFTLAVTFAVSQQAVVVPKFSVSLHPPQTRLETKPKMLSVAPPLPAPVLAVAQAPSPALPEMPLSHLEEALEKKFANHPALKRVLTERRGDSIEITFRSDPVFEPGRAEMRAEAHQAITDLAAVILDQTKNRIPSIQVEGHTDDLPIIRNRKLFRSNWELSGARASAVLELFEKAGHSSKKLQMIGFGESRPRFPNLDEGGQPIPANRAKNRRLVIRIASDQG